VPDCYFCGQTFEEPTSCIVNRKVASLAFGALIAFPWFKTFHQADRGTVGKGDLLVTAANPKYGLSRLFDDREDSCQ